jgi:Anti-sigma-28 factor, FlgM
MNRRTRGGDPDPQTTPQPNTVTRLKQQIATGRYRVDADAVAREMLFKLRLIRLSRRALLADRRGQGGRPAGRSPGE